MPQLASFPFALGLPQMTINPRLLILVPAMNDTNILKFLIK